MQAARRGSATSTMPAERIAPPKRAFTNVGPPEPVILSMSVLIKAIAQSFCALAPEPCRLRTLPCTMLINEPRIIIFVLFDAWK